MKSTDCLLKWPNKNAEYSQTTGNKVSYVHLHILPTLQFKVGLAWLLSRLSPFSSWGFVQAMVEFGSAGWSEDADAAIAWSSAPNLGL